MSILIIDDEKGILFMLKKLLDDRGYSTLTSSNAKEGIELAKKEIPQLILIDIAMPILNGYEACKKLRSDPATKKIPILIMTGKELTAEGIMKRCEDLGIDGFLYKPFSVEKLLKRIEKLAPK